MFQQMFRLFLCFMKKPDFPTRDAPIEKTNLFLLSGRAVFRYRNKSLQEKQAQTDRKNNFKILIICENKLSKAELQKSNFVKKIKQYNSPYFLVKFFVIPVHFHYFTFCFKLYFPIADITVNHLYILFLRSRKINTKWYNQKRKKSRARNIVASKNISIFDLCQNRLMHSGKLRSNVKS